MQKTQPEYDSLSHTKTYPTPCKYIFHSTKLTLFPALVSIFFCLLLSSCQLSETPQKYATEDKQWLERFFKILLFHEEAIYTLWGDTKPLTLAIIFHFTEEEKQAYYNSLSQEEKENGIWVDNDDFFENWQKWKNFSEQLSMKRYMLFESKLFKDEGATFILFVDVIKTAMVIQENYDAFREAVGFDFHPLEVVLNIQNDDEPFWQKMNSKLWGLLFGYGKRNAQLFHWKYYNNTEKTDKFFEFLPSFFSHYSKPGKLEYSIQHFDIPSFVSFDETDGVIEQYKKERDKIQEIYKDKDFIDLTLQKLTSTIQLDSKID